jgi:hypothetical protein
MRFAPFRPLLLLPILACGSSGGQSGSGPGGSRYVCAAPCGPVSIAQMQTNPWPIAVSGGRVYWVDHTDAFNGIVRSVATTGGSVTDIAMAPNVRGLGWTSLAADDTFVYWTTGAANAANVVEAAPVGGGAARTLYTDPSVTGTVYSLAPAGGALYAQSSQGLVRIDRQSGVATPLDARAQCWAQIAIDGQSLYCVGQGLTQYALGGNTATTLVATMALAPDHLVAVGVGSSQLFLMGYDSTSEKASLFTVATSGGTPSKLAAGLQVKSEWFVVNDAGLFWVGGVPGGPSYPLMQLGLSGGTPSVANARGAANFMAADAHGVYLCDYYGDIDEYAF